MRFSFQTFVAGAIDRAIQTARLRSQSRRRTRRTTEMLAAISVETLEVRALLSGGGDAGQVSESWFGPAAPPGAGISEVGNAAERTRLTWIVQFTNEALAGVSSIDDTQSLLPSSSSLQYTVVRGLGAVGQVTVSTTGQPADVVAQQFAANPDVAYFQQDRKVKIADSEVPNDPLFGNQWGLNNVGQQGGTPGADVDALSAWQLTKGSHEVVVADIDTGIDYSHPDLVANMWVNPFESNNGLDNDGNGFVGDLYGWDFANKDNAPLDDNSHGTHTAGIIGAVGDNGIGVTGVNWDVQLMALKAFDKSGGASESNLIAAINYATMMKIRGVNVVAINASWGSGGYDIAMLNAIKAAGAQNIMFVAAAGNYNSNNDASPFYPANYNADNVISVASTDNKDNLSSFSDYGLNTVDLGAPGSSIYSTLPGGGYGYKSGTSMATPFVTGAVALLQSMAYVTNQAPYTFAEVKKALLDSVDPLPSLASKVTSGGRLNVRHAIEHLLDPLTAVPESYVAASVGPGAIDLVAGAPGVMTLIDSADNASVAFDLGSHVFRFYGHEYTGANSLYVSSNGLITLGQPNTSGSAVDLLALGMPAIAPYWDNLRTDVDSTDQVLAAYLDIGGLGRPQLVIQWNVYHTTSQVSPVKFQAVLGLDLAVSDNGIAFLYPDLDFEDAAQISRVTSAVGITDGTGLAAGTLDLSFVTYPQVGTGHGVLFDRTRPSATVQQVTPSPQPTGIDSLLVQFTDPILPGSFDASDIILTRNGQLVPVNGVVTMESVSPALYRINGLFEPTSFNGDYTLTVDMTGISDLAGHLGFGTPQTSWTTQAGESNVKMLSATTDGLTTLTVTYEIENFKLSMLDLGIYASQTAGYVPGTGTLVDLLTINSLEDLTVGVHTVTYTVGANVDQVQLPGAGVADLTGDYHLLFVADPGDAIPEDEAAPGVDNTVEFSGVYHVTKGLVEVFGTAGTDVASAATVSTNVTVTLNGTTYTYVATDVTGVNVRLQGGDDSLDVSTLAKIVTAWGGDDNDALKGGTLADVLGGSAGNDTVTGNAGNDSLTGGAGNDSLVGSAGNDSYLFDADLALGTDTINESGGGNDTLDFTGTALGVTVNLATATTQVVNGSLSLNLQSATTVENVIGGDGNDSLTGNTLANVLTGGAGNDTQTGGTGNDTYRYDSDWQSGSDTLVENASAGTDLIDLAATAGRSVIVDLSLTTPQVVNTNLTVTLSSGTNFENVNGGSLADLLLGNTAANVLSGNAGNDTINGGDGNDVLEGGVGNDSLTGGAGNDSYKFGTNTGLGSDTLVELTGGGTDTLDFSSSTTLGVLVNLATATSQVVNANLTLNLGSGSVFENVTGGSQNDTLTGNTLANTLTGNAGNDTLTGSDGNDSLTGNAGNDSLVGGNGNDSYNFSTNTAQGSDTVTDTLGTDTLNFSTSTTLGVTVDLSSTAAQVVNTNLTLTLASASAIENVTGGSQADTLTGNTLANALVGNSGNDSLNGQSGNDTLTGGAGNDVLTGGPGDDSYPLNMNSALGSDTVVEAAGGGTDILDFSASTTLGITLDLASTAPQVLNANLTLTLSAADGLEWVIGTAKNDIVSGNTLNNVLIGGAGNDQLSGFSGRDLIVGGSGTGTLKGGDDDDILIAGTFTYFNETTKSLNATGLKAIMNEWSQLAVAYAARVSNLKNGGGLNGTNKLDSTTVVTDGTAIDNLWGEGGLDWFWAFASDLVNDQEEGELIDP